MIESTNSVLALVGGVVTICLGLLGAWVRWGLPKAKQRDAVSEAILGRGEVAGRSGSVIQPAQPGMVAQVATLTETVRELVNMNHRVDIVESRVDQHDVLLEQIQRARQEQVVTKVESANMWAAVKAVHESDPPD